MMLTIPTIPLETRAKLFRGFCDPSRLSILEALRVGPRSVGDLVVATSLGQPNVSNHLACLLDCGLVVREQQGRFGIYSLADARVDELLALAEALLADVARGVRYCPRYEGDGAGSDRSEGTACR
ncbi:MAG TPA: metalloregulator ArsR/SmtB family transcription factor [Longimicrobium sp.]|nr:metalloregulator ArsR/SmtB family transcription factor [Longimicrobium sp.]